MVIDNSVNSVQAQPTRVVIADDNWITCFTLSSYLAGFGDIDVIGIAYDGAEAVRVCGELEPDLVLMDSWMPGMDCITATRLIHQDHPATRIIILSTGEPQDQEVLVMHAGASRVIDQLHTGEALIGHIRDVMGSQLTPA